MPVLKEQTLPLTNDTDIVQARQLVRQMSEELKFSLVEQTKVVTAASELARNTVMHGKGGTVTIQALQEGLREGLRVVFEDKGPGIPDLQMALKDGYTTGSGLGLGLGGARRLVSDFDIQSKPGQGTRVTITRWR